MNDDMANGSNVSRMPVDPRGNMISNRTVWLSLPEPFDNLEIKAWLDYPREIAMLWTPVEGETAVERGRRTIMAARETFMEHRAVNGQPWADEDGELPPPTTEEFWERIPTPLGASIITAFLEEMAGNRKSRGSRRKMRPKFGRSSS